MAACPHIPRKVSRRGSSNAHARRGLVFRTTWKTARPSLRSLCELRLWRTAFACLNVSSLAKPYQRSPVGTGSPIGCGRFTPFTQWVTCRRVGRRPWRPPASRISGNPRVLHVRASPLGDETRIPPPPMPVDAPWSLSLQFSESCLAAFVLGIQLKRLLVVVNRQRLVAGGCICLAQAVVRVP
jgi:hypothetical protein